MRHAGKIAYTVKDACEAAGIRRTTFYKLRKEKVIWTFSFGGRTLIYADVLEAALAASAEPVRPRAEAA